ncbi:MAG: topoisomerase I protein, partial [Candidatus Pacebacteria bacterium GW2011_GWA1_46_10]
MDLVIVESPTKAKTLGKFLGPDYQIEASFGHIRDLPQNEASFGHIRDLPQKKLGIKTDKNFEPEYVQTDKQKAKTEEIKKLSDKATKIFLATDPDREGEAIAFHVAELLKGNSKSEILNPKFSRIVFHEITEHAIKEALEHPRELDMKLVDAQQARRILDRLVGYKLSPLLWKKIRRGLSAVRRGLSAGRVQSVTVRLVVEKEREIEAFIPVEFWDINVVLSAKGQVLSVKLMTEIKNQLEADEAEQKLVSSQFIVDSVEKKEFKRTPPAPFTTSTLQQAAANRLGWSAKRTMQIAQGLYEEGHITYHRTDSTNLAAEAVSAAKDFITTTYGKEYALETPRLFKTKSKVAQEAHEAIRPTDVSAQPTMLSAQFNRDQERLYELIWKRFVACQMMEVTGVTVTVTVTGGEYKLQAKGETISFEGWY